LWFPNIFWPEKYNFLGLAHSRASNNITFTTFLAPLIHDQYGKRQAILMCQVIVLMYIVYCFIINLCCFLYVATKPFDNL
jgi:hypothetical protein